MSWKNDSPPTAEQGNRTIMALDIIHATLHMVLCQQEGDTEGADEMDETIEEAFQTLKAATSDDREFLRAMLAATTSLVLNYEGVTGFPHHDMFLGLEQSIHAYQSGLN